MDYSSNPPIFNRKSREMKVGIYDVYNGVDMPHQKIYEQILTYNNIDYSLLNINDPDFWHRLQEIDILIYKWSNNDNQHQLSNILRPIFDSLGIKYYPNYETTWHYDDKIKQYFLLKEHGADPVESYIYFNKDAAIEFINSASFPLVAKLTKGASSSNVRLIKTKAEAKRYIQKAFSIKGIRPQYFGSYWQLSKTLDNSPKKIIIYYLKKLKRRLRGVDLAYWQNHKNYVYFQKYLPGNEYDTRVTTVGNRVHAFRRFVRKGDFRASGGEKWDINPDEIDPRMLRIALDFSKKMNFQTMAYDFIYDRNKNPRIVEISYLYGQPGFPDFMNGYWDFDLKWIEGRYWPQFFEMKDLLQVNELQCPDIAVPREWIKNTII
jgi:glutathione synthase/RimK-type ligase-like ATP-grasp enzyme